MSTIKHAIFFCICSSILLLLSTISVVAANDTANNNPVGDWRIVGSHSELGRYTGTATIFRRKNNTYGISISVVYANSSSYRGNGNGEYDVATRQWQSEVLQKRRHDRRVVAEETVKHQLILSADGTQMSGQWQPIGNNIDNNNVRADIRMIKADSGPQIVTIEPPSLKSGTSAVVLIYGIDFDEKADIDWGEGIEVLQDLYKGPAVVAMEIKAASDAPVGPRTVKVGDIVAHNLFAIE